MSRSQKRTENEQATFVCPCCGGRETGLWTQNADAFVAETHEPRQQGNQKREHVDEIRLAIRGFLINDLAFGSPELTAKQAWETIAQALRETADDIRERRLS